MNYQIHEIPAGAGGPTAKLSLYLWDNSEELDDGLLRPMVQQERGTATGSNNGQCQRFRPGDAGGKQPFLYGCA